MRILNDKDQEITKYQISDLKGAPVPATISEREHKRRLLQPLFDRLKKLGISGEMQARTWCEGALAHPLAKMADIKEEEIPSLVDVAKKALGEPLMDFDEVVALAPVAPGIPKAQPNAPQMPADTTSSLDAVKECLANSPVGEEKRMCGTNGCANKPEEREFCEECSRTQEIDVAVSTMVSNATNHADSLTAEAIVSDPGQEPEKPDARPSLEVAIGSHASITTGRLAPYITRLRSWNLRKLSPERRKRFRSIVTELELAWDNLRQELQTLAAEGFVAKTSPSTRLAATLRVGDAVELDESQLALFSEVYSPEELADLKVDAITDTHAVVSGPLRSLGPVKLCHLAKK
jgi:hypothetical protein